MKTFFSMYKKDVDFRAQVANTKGFCLDHFKVLCEGADEQLSGEEKKEFYATVLPLMKKNFHRVYEDVAWFIEKYDYKTKMPAGKIPKMPFSAACRNCVAATRPCLLMC